MEMDKFQSSAANRETREPERTNSRAEEWAREFHRSTAEEWANAMSHFAGFVFGIFALTFMCVLAAQEGDPRRIVGNAIFGFTLIFLYNWSTLYHLVWRNSVKSVFQIMDHVSIYLLIAGTYTPYCLIVQSAFPGRGWSIFGIVWGLALLGIASELFIKPRREWLAITLTLLMGWLAVLIIRPIMLCMTPLASIMLLVGGAVYTLGVVFYAMDKIPYMHTIWHFFVLGGSVCHWVSVTFG